MSGPGDSYGLGAPEPEDVYESRDGLADSILAPRGPSPDAWAAILTNTVEQLRPVLARFETIAEGATGATAQAAELLACEIRTALDKRDTLAAKAPTGRNHPNPKPNPEGAKS